MKIKNEQFKPAWIGLIFFLSASLLFSACQQKEAQQALPQTTEIAGESLAKYFEQHGDYINSELAPAIINAAAVYQNRNNNIKVIDLRSAPEFEAGHIEGAVNVQMKDLLNYYTHQIDALAFDTIVLACAKGQTSGYVTGVMRLLGYDNTFSLRFGMSSWNSAFGDAGWDKSIGNELVGKLETRENSMPPAENYPSIQTTATLPFAIAMERADSC